MAMGDRIKEQRKIIHMTQDELGEKLGVQKSAVAKWENGRVQNIKRSIIQQMAVIFGCDPAYLMGFEESDEVEEEKDEEILLSNEEELLLNMFRNLNNNGREKVIEYLLMLHAFGKYSINAESELHEKNKKEE